MTTRAPAPDAPREDLVREQATELPIGLVFARSVNVTRRGAMISGCAISRDVLSTQFFASDFFCGPGQDPQQYAAHFGPFVNAAAARASLNAEDLTDFDTSGTNGISAWLVLP